MNILDNEGLINYVDELSGKVENNEVKPNDAMWRLVGYLLGLIAKEQSREEQ